MHPPNLVTPPVPPPARSETSARGHSHRDHHSRASSPGGGGKAKSLPLPDDLPTKQLSQFGSMIDSGKLSAPTFSFSKTERFSVDNVSVLHRSPGGAGGRPGLAGGHWA